MANRNKNSDVFRQKSLDRVSSPENLDNYIKSTTPTLWLLLGIVVALLVGVIVWGTFGKIDSASVVGCRAEDGVVTAYIKEAESEKLSEESYIEINGEQYAITEAAGPFMVSGSSDSFLIRAAEIEDGAWYYAVTCAADLADGEYKGKLVYEEISPITFIVNSEVLP